MMRLEKPKKFLFVMGFSCPFAGAGWNRISYLARYFLENGVDCSILSTFLFGFKNRSVKNTRILIAKNIRIYNIIPQIPYYENAFSIILNSFVAFLSSLTFCLFKRPDLIIVSIWPADQLLGVFWVAKLLKTKLVIDYRDEVEENWISDGKKPRFFYQVMKKVLTKIYRDSYLVTPTTFAVANNLRQKGVYNVQVVADGVDTAMFKPMDKGKMKRHLNISMDTFVLIFLGGVYGAYRVDIIVRALKLLKDKNPRNESKYCLLLAGAGRIEELLKYADSLGVSSMVRYVGEIKDPAEVVKVINAADVGIIPYGDNPNLRRMVPTKLFEYTACGIPVIGTVNEDSILAGYLRKYSIGLTVPPLDGDSLAKAIEDIGDVMKNQSELNSNTISFARTYDKAQIAKELLSCIMKDD